LVKHSNICTTYVCEFLIVLCFKLSVFCFSRECWKWKEGTCDSSRAQGQWKTAIWAYVTCSVFSCIVRRKVSGQYCNLQTSSNWNCSCLCALPQAFSVSFMNKCIAITSLFWFMLVK